LESLTKMAQAALVEDFNRMVARQAREAATPGQSLEQG
jgi:hypothetical protein